MMKRISVALALALGLALIVPRAQAQDLTTMLSKFLVDLRAGTWGINQPVASITATSNITTPILTSSNIIRWNSNGTRMVGTSDGQLVITNAAQTIGSTIKVDALPTVSSAFGTSPAITAGSTPFAGSVNIGTGGVAVSGVINFNGTAFPSAPFCVCGATLTNTTCRTGTTTTQLTITSNVAWTASDVVDWICASVRF